MQREEGVSTVRERPARPGSGVISALELRHCGVIAAREGRHSGVGRAWDGRKGCHCGVGAARVGRQHGMGGVIAALEGRHRCVELAPCPCRRTRFCLCRGTFWVGGVTVDLNEEHH